jgi:ABC-type glutathione transport system ATPase component
VQAELAAQGIGVRAGGRTLLSDASLRIPAGGVTAVVGPSGAGKSTLARALVGLVRAEPGVVAGRVQITGPTPRVWEAGQTASVLHGAGLSWAPQDAWGSLSPFEPISAALRRAGSLDAGAALARVGLPAAVGRAHPHTLSGGMARRAALAVALASRPQFLIADEPTTGLDPTVGEAILAMLRALAGEGLGVLVLGHDLLALRRHATRIVLVAEGRVLEEVEPGARFQTPVGRALDAAGQGPPWA